MIYIKNVGLRWLAGLAGLAYLLTYVGDFLEAYDKVFLGASIRVLILCLAGGFYGIMRVVRYHPVFRKDYGAWLGRTPWVPSMKLPFGNVQLGLFDMSIAVILVAACSLNEQLPRFAGELPMLLGEYFWLHPLVVILVAHSLMVYVADLKGTKNTLWRYVCWSVPFLLPFLFYPHRSILVAAFVSVGLSLLMRGLHVHTLPALTERLQARSQAGPLVIGGTTLGWPLRYYGREELCKNWNNADPMISAPVSACLALLIGWYLFILCSVVGRAPSTFMVSVLVVSMAMIRVILYMGNRMPPISLLGRLRTCRFVIPGFDRVFILPALVAALGAVFLKALDAVGVSAEVAFSLGVAVAGYLLLAHGETLEEWKLTGHYRLMRPAVTARSKQVGVLQIRQGRG